MLLVVKARMMRRRFPTRILVYAPNANIIVINVCTPVSNHATGIYIRESSKLCSPTITFFISIMTEYKTGKMIKIHAPTLFMHNILMALILTYVSSFLHPGFFFISNESSVDMI